MPQAHLLGTDICCIHISDNFKCRHQAVNHHKGSPQAYQPHWGCHCDHVHDTSHIILAYSCWTSAWSWWVLLKYQVMSAPMGLWQLFLAVDILSKTRWYLWNQVVAFSSGRQGSLVSSSPSQWRYKACWLLLPAVSLQGWWEVWCIPGMGWWGSDPKGRPSYFGYYPFLHSFLDFLLCCHRMLWRCYFFPRWGGIVIQNILIHKGDEGFHCLLQFPYTGHQLMCFTCPGWSSFLGPKLSHLCICQRLPWLYQPNILTHETSSSLGKEDIPLNTVGHRWQGVIILPFSQALCFRELKGCPHPFGKVYRVPWDWNLQKFWPSGGLHLMGMPPNPFIRIIEGWSWGWRLARLIPAFPR